MQFSTGDDGIHCEPWGNWLLKGKEPTHMPERQQGVHTELRNID
jgi:hypothetical protein